MSNIAVSVIIPVYNVEKYLEECLDSVLRQSYRGFEMILVDDGSTDSSGAICDRYAEKDSRIAAVIHKENGGQSQARNIGMKAASGEYIYFLDSDDYITDDAIEKMLDAAERNRADIVSFDSDTIAEDGCETLSYDELYCRHRYPPARGAVMSLRMIKNREFTFCPQLHFFRRSFLEKNGLSFREGIIYEDMLYASLAYLKAGRTVHLNSRLLVRRIRKDSTMRKAKSLFNIRSYYVCASELLKARRLYDTGSVEERFINEVVEDPAGGIVRDYAYLPAAERQQGEKYVRKLKAKLRKVGYLGNRRIRLKLGYYRIYSCYTRSKEAVKAALRTR